MPTELYKPYVVGIPHTDSTHTHTWPDWVIRMWVPQKNGREQWTVYGRLAPSTGHRSAFIFGTREEAMRHVASMTFDDYFYDEAYPDRRHFYDEHDNDVPVPYPKSLPES